MAVQRRGEIADLLRRRVVVGLHLGLLKPGDQLPSARDLSRELKAHQRVILGAYRELEREGLVEFRPRSGVYVAVAAASPGATLPSLSEWAVEVAMQGLSRGIPTPELPDRLRRCFETLRLRAVCVECNADQLRSLCLSLHRDYGLESTEVEIDALESPEVLPELRRTDVLVTTSFHTTPVKRVAERVGKPWIAVRLRSDVLSEIGRYLASGPVYFVATDPRFAPKLQVMFGPLPGGENLRLLIVGRDDGEIARIPESAPTYIMQRARERLEKSPLVARVPPLVRVFAPESAREILSFIVRANMAAVAAQVTKH